MTEYQLLILRIVYFIANVVYKMYTYDDTETSELFIRISYEVIEFQKKYGNVRL